MEISLFCKNNYWLNLTEMIKKILALPIVVAMIALGFAGSASAQTVSPLLQIQLATNGLTSPLVAGGDDATVARLRLDTTGSAEAVRISSLPFILTTGSGAQADTLNNCRVFNEAAGTVALNTADADDTLDAGRNNIELSSALVVPAGSQMTLALRCDVDEDLVAGGTFTFSMNSADVVATGAASGVRAIVTVPGAAVIPPIVVTPPVVVVPPATPGMPATGANSDAAKNVALAIGTVLLAGLAMTYSSRKSQNA